MPTFLLASTTNPVPPTVSSDEKRFVDDAVVAKKFVVVALVVVELPVIVKFPRIVDEAVEIKPPVRVETEPPQIVEVEVVPNLPQPNTLRSPGFIAPMVIRLESISVAQIFFHRSVDVPIS